MWPKLGFSNTGRWVLVSDWSIVLATFSYSVRKVVVLPMALLLFHLITDLHVGNSPFVFWPSTLNHRNVLVTYTWPHQLIDSTDWLPFHYMRSLMHLHTHTGIFPLCVFWPSTLNHRNVLGMYIYGILSCHAIDQLTDRLPLLHIVWCVGIEELVNPNTFLVSNDKENGYSPCLNSSLQFPPLLNPHCL